VPETESPRQHVIGWIEHVSLPEWGIKRLRCKTDTGARSSALDVEGLEEIGDGCVRFEVPLRRRDRSRRAVVEAQIIRRATVKSSLGDPHDRFFVRTVLKVGTVEKEIEIGLVSREKMLYRMLLGRIALAETFLVDVSRKYILSNPPSRRKRAAPRRDES